LRWHTVPHVRLIKKMKKRASSSSLRTAATMLASPPPPPCSPTRHRLLRSIRRAPLFPTAAAVLPRPPPPKLEICIFHGDCNSGIAASGARGAWELGELDIADWGARPQGVPPLSGAGGPQPSAAAMSGGWLAMTGGLADGAWGCGGGGGGKAVGLGPRAGAAGPGAVGGASRWPRPGTGRGQRTNRGRWVTFFTFFY
jgi:hypothetical protein